MRRRPTQSNPRKKVTRPNRQKGTEGNGSGDGSSFTRQRQCGVSGRGGWIEVTRISHGVEIAISRGVAEPEDALTTVIESHPY